MWKWLHPYANPEVAYNFTNKLLPWLSVLATVFLSIGLVWALMFAPADYQQGDSFSHILYSCASRSTFHGHLCCYGYCRFKQPCLAT